MDGFLLCYDVHDVKDTLLKAYDGLRLVTTCAVRENMWDKYYDGLGRDYIYYAPALSLCRRICGMEREGGRVAV